MFRILLVLIFLIAGPAYAANIFQGDQGETVWRDADGDEWPAGDSGLTVTIEDISTAATDFVVTGKAGLITKVIVTPHGNFNSDSNESTLTFATADGSTSDFTSGEFGAAHTLTVVTNAVGQSDTLTITTGYSVNVGDVIAIETDGGSTGATVGTVTIIIE